MVTSVLRIRVLSVSSSSSSAGSSRDSRKVSRMNSKRSGRSNCLNDRFTATVAGASAGSAFQRRAAAVASRSVQSPIGRSEEHTSELQSLMRISYAVFCLKKKKKKKHTKLQKIKINQPHQSKYR